MFLQASQQDGGATLKRRRHRVTRTGGQTRRRPSGNRFRAPGVAPVAAGSVKVESNPSPGLIPNGILSLGCRKGPAVPAGRRQAIAATPYIRAPRHRTLARRALSPSSVGCGAPFGGGKAALGSGRVSFQPWERASGAPAGHSCRGFWVLGTGRTVCYRSLIRQSGPRSNLIGKTCPLMENVGRAADPSGNAGALNHLNKNVCGRVRLRFTKNHICPELATD